MGTNGSVAVLLAFALVACAPGEGDCYIGRVHGECGGRQGDGSPRFACPPDDLCRPDEPCDARLVDTCRWFVGGVVPTGYRASACPADDICCADTGEDGTFAVPNGPFPGRSRPNFFGRWGGEPWDGERDATIDVVVDPELTVLRGGVLVDCGGAEDCLESLVLFDEPPDPDTVSWVLRHPEWQLDILLRSDLWLEVLPDEDGGARARLCVFTGLSDTVSPTCGANVRCAEGGTLTVPALPTSLDELRETSFRLAYRGVGFGSFPSRIPTDGTLTRGPR